MDDSLGDVDPGGGRLGLERLSPAVPRSDSPPAHETSNLAGTRTIISIDTGTTYGTIGALTLPVHASLKDVKPSDITYLDNYAYERLLFSQPGNATPMYLYIDPKRNGEIQWGWQVVRRLAWSNDSIHQHPDRCFSSFKLLLDETDATTQIRAKLQNQLRILKKAGVIHHEDDILYHYLVKWFTFARERGIDNGVSHPEFVVCVPSAYSVSSFHRWFKAYNRAIRTVWTAFSDSVPPKIFTISEPAAGASFCLAQRAASIALGECVLVIDCGGGTIELITYRKTQDGYEEVCLSSSDTCGGNSLNEAARKIMKERLSIHAAYLAKPNVSIDTIVESEFVQPFEIEQKRNDPIGTSRIPEFFRVDGLKADRQYGFEEGRLYLLDKDWPVIFQHSLAGLETLLDEQHSRVIEKKERISRVCWVGQFSDSNLLRERGHTVMRKWPKPPVFVYDKTISMTAVSGGGIFGSLNRDYSPTRFLRASFALERAVQRPWDTEDERKAIDWTKCPGDAALRRAHYTKGKDGDFYSFNTLEWFIQAGQEFAPGHRFPFSSTHLFPVNDTDADWIVSEQLWYSSKGDKQSYYKDKHPHNSDAAVLGTIKFNLSPLKKVALPIRGEGNARCYEVKLHVTVRMLEGFRHEVEVTARWVREAEDGFAEFMVVDGLDGVPINISAAFEVTAI